MRKGKAGTRGEAPAGKGPDRIRPAARWPEGGGGGKGGSPGCARSAAECSIARGRAAESGSARAGQGVGFRLGCAIDEAASRSTGLDWADRNKLCGGGVSGRADGGAGRVRPIHGVRRWTGAGEVLHLEIDVHRHVGHSLGAELDLVPLRGHRTAPSSSAKYQSKLRPRLNATGCVRRRWFRQVVSPLRCVRLGCRHHTRYPATFRPPSRPLVSHSLQEEARFALRELFFFANRYTR